MALLGVVNRNVLLRGFALTRRIPILRDLPLLRGYFRVRELDLPLAELETLREAVNPGTAAFIGPNHPEFGCDWMIDKEISTLVAPQMASWADRGIVASAPGFWGMNNLVANDGGDAAREYSIECALRGEGVLLHPEGSVRWTSNYVHPLFPGIAQMAIAAAERTERPVFIVPIVWKMRYLHNITRALLREMRAMEDALGVRRGDEHLVAERFAALQENLLAARMRRFAYEPRAESFFARQSELRSHLLGVLAERYDAGDADSIDRRTTRIAKMIRTRLSALRDDDSPAAVAERNRLRKDAEMADEVKRLGEFTEELYGGATLTQEQIAESLKRMRDRLMKQTKAHRMANMLPRPYGTRIAHIGVPAPIRVQRVPQHEKAAYERTLLAEMRASMQSKLDEINARIEPRVAGYRIVNRLVNR
jgi:hypothetical protein